MTRDCQELYFFTHPAYIHIYSHIRRIYSGQPYIEVCVYVCVCVRVRVHVSVYVCVSTPSKSSLSCEMSCRLHGELASYKRGDVIADLPLESTAPSSAGLFIVVSGMVGMSSL